MNDVALSVTGSMSAVSRPLTHDCWMVGASRFQTFTGCPSAFTVGRENTVAVRLPSVAVKVPSAFCVSSVAWPAEA